MIARCDGGCGRGLGWAKGVLLVVVLAWGGVVGGEWARGAGPPDGVVTLERIMRGAEWVSRAPEGAYWSDDSRTVYFMRRGEEGEERELWRVRVAGGEAERVPVAEVAGADQRWGDVSVDGRVKAYVREGDVYVKELATGKVRQLTRTAEAEGSPRVLAGGARVMFRRGGAVLVRDLESGLEYQPVEVRAESDPEEKAEKAEKGEYLRAQQSRLFEALRRGEERREKARERAREAREADGLRAPRAWYVGDKHEVREVSVSPDERWALVQVAAKGRREGRREAMPAYVTEDGYVSSRAVRGKVGEGERVGVELRVLDLRAGAERVVKVIDLGVLPEICEDRLKGVRGEEAAAEGGEEGKKGVAAKQRGVWVSGVEWSDDGSRVLVSLASVDHKDVWLAEVDLEAGALAALEHFYDEAWINMRFAAAGWMPDGRRVWFLSEESGSSRLYVRDAGGGGRYAVALEGASNVMCEVSGVRISRDRRWMYFRANADVPWEHQLFRLDAGAAEEGGLVAQRLTRIGGLSEFSVSPDGTMVLVENSRATRPPELFVCGVAGVGEEAVGEDGMRRLTGTVTEEFAGIEWIEPEVVAVPGREGRRIWSRVYDAGGAGNAGVGRPAVMFVHGAGYLQDAHDGWGHYWREHLFHDMLARRGYVVLSMDYRASAGYGREWRTAVYRGMGTPELEDLEDGVAWLVAERGVDPGRIGVYGGSYGGFLTLMAMFTRPELFACGAALRPVTDWAHYSEGYTSNILNTPGVDPGAYERSSPIEFAAGLERALLICHGMQDDNVFFQDTVRLAQRLIELGKENWEVAMYPVEGHAFRESASWLDEYRRVLRLFERWLEKE